MFSGPTDDYTVAYPHCPPCSFLILVIICLCSVQGDYTVTYTALLSFLTQVITCLCSVLGDYTDAHSHCPPGSFLIQMNTCLLRFNRLPHCHLPTLPSSQSFLTQVNTCSYSGPAGVRCVVSKLIMVIKPPTSFRFLWSSSAVSTVLTRR